jgi:hypothetical protein
MYVMLHTVAKRFDRRLTILGSVGDHIHDHVELFMGKTLVEVPMMGPVAVYSADVIAEIIGRSATIEEGHPMPILQ